MATVSDLPGQSSGASIPANDCHRAWGTLSHRPASAKAGHAL